MKKAIVTGSNGFIGSNVCKRLCADGIKVFAVVKDENENIDNIKNLSGIEIVYCELDEIETLADVISDRDIDVFYHFAWVGSAGSLRCDENVQLQNALWPVRALRTADKMQWGRRRRGCPGAWPCQAARRLHSLCISTHFGIA